VGGPAALIAVAPWPLAVSILAGGTAFVGPTWSVVISSYSLTLTLDRLRGRVGGVQGLAAWGPIPLGSLVGGLLLQWFGGVTTTLALAAAGLAIAVAAFASPAVRHAPRLTRPVGDRDAADATPML